MSRFWLSALLSAFQPSSGTNEEGLQIAAMHLARFVFFYTGVPSASWKWVRSDGVEGGFRSLR